MPRKCKLQPGGIFPIKVSSSELGELTSFTCTECHGALIRIVEDKHSRYRCHTGHGYTEETLLESVI